MTIGRVVCKSEDDRVTKARTVNISVAAPYQEEEAWPQGLSAAKNITSVRRRLMPHGTARWDFITTCTPSCLDFITCSCKLEVTRLYCQRELSCFHSSSANLKYSSKKNGLMLHDITNKTAGECASDSRMDLCECLSICVGSKVHFRLHCVPQHLLFPLWSFFNLSLCCHCDILCL